MEIPRPRIVPTYSEGSKLGPFQLYFWQISQYRCTENISHIVGLVQKRCNSIANALELHLPCTNLLICNNLILTNVQEILPLWIKIVPPFFSGKLTNGEIDYWLYSLLAKPIKYMTSAINLSACFWQTQGMRAFSGPVWKITEIKDFSST